MRVQISVAFLIAALLCQAASSEVTGKFTVGKESIEPKFGAAYVSRSQFNARKKQVEVVLSVEKVDPVEAAANIDPHTNMINQEGMKANYVLIFVGPDGEVGMNACFAENMSQYLASTKGGELKAEFKVNTPERLAGRVYTPAPVKTQDGTVYQADFAFDVAVAHPPAGTKIANGGGDPGKAFLAALDALKKKDLAVIQQHLAKETYDRYIEDYRSPKENLDYLLEMVSMSVPSKNIKITGGDLRGDTAILEVEGDSQNGIPSLFLVRMIKAGNGWVMETSRAVGML